MRNAHPRYMCFPAVLCVGKETEVTVVPRDNSRLFRKEKEYALAVVGLRDDQESYHEHIPLNYPCEVADGCLKFTFTPDREQEYSVRFAEKDGEEIKIALYAVKEDLYALRPLKGDLHTHTWYSDGADGVTMTPADYREEGFDFFALTDHNRMYPSVLANDLYKDVKLGMHIMRGEEVHTPGSLVHIVHIGGKESVCEKYIHDPVGYEAAVAEIAETMEHIPTQYRSRMAMAKWACENIRKAGGLAIFAHPFWCPNRYNESEEFLEMLFDEKIFDAFELMGGIQPKLNNLQVALWQERMMRGNVLPVVGSSDSHNHDFASTGFGRRFTYVFAKANTTEAILEAIRNGYSVAGELPMNSESEVRFYGTKLRLVLFAHFLFEHYFNETWRLCVGEGILMRRYAEGEDVGAALSALADTVENHYKKFYGMAPAPIVTAECRAFLDRAGEQQRTVGPETKGSSLFIYGKNGRRE